MATEQPGHAPAALADRALIQLFCDRAGRQPHTVALRYKDYGLWQEVTWAHCREQVELFALGLLALGLQPGERVAIMGDPTPEWLYSDLAVQSVGGITCGLYVTLPPPAIRYMVANGGARFFIAENQEYVDKLLTAEDGHPLVERIIVMDMQGMFAYQDPRLCSFAAVLAQGRQRREREPGRWEALVASRRADEVIRIFYTSGTTGLPKGALLSSRNLVWTWAVAMQALGLTPDERDRTVSYMPLAHLGEVIYSLILPILFGVVVYIPEGAEAQREAMVEVGPTLLLAFPRVWETYAARVLYDLEAGDRLKRAVYNLAMAVRRRLFRYIWADQTPPLWLQAASRLAHWAVFHHILNKFGFQNLRMVVTGGAPVSPEVVRLWQLWGVHIMEAYGMTECAALATVQADRIPRPGVAGRPAPGIELKLAPDGEILLRSPGVFQGYWQDPAATAEAVDGEGWLHTGDIGEFLPDGNLRVVDRKKDILITAHGQVVPTSEVEHVLKFSPYIRDAMLIGDGRAFLTALIEIDFDTVSEWARARGITYTSFTHLALNPATQELLQREVNTANATLRERGRPLVQDFRVLPKELDPEAGDEITPTRKVRRRQLAEKFAHLVEEMYRSEAGERIARQLS